MVASAILTRANVIVTFNKIDFPEVPIEKFRLHVKRPDDLFLETFGLGPQQFSEAVIDDFRHYQQPQLEFGTILPASRKPAFLLCRRPSNL